MEQAISNAKVRIKMKGLGIAHLNSGVWEFLFLRKIKKHELTVIIKEYGKDNNCRQIGQPIVIDEDLQKFEITTTNPVPVESYHKPAGSGNFTFNSEDPKDARWVVNLSELYGDIINPSTVRIEKRITDRKLTLLTVSNAKLYCYELSEHFYKFEGVGGTKLPVLRNVGLWLGLAIELNADSETSVIIGNNPIPLKNHNTLDYYEIEVNNDCYPCDLDQIDFHHYFREFVVDYRINQSGPFNFDGSLAIIERNEKNAKAFLGGRVDCHLVQISKIADEKGKVRSSLAELL